MNISKLASRVLWIPVILVLSFFAFMPVVGDSTAWHPYFISQAGFDPINVFFDQIENPRTGSRPTPFWMPVLSVVYLITAIIANFLTLEIWAVQGVLKIFILAISAVTLSKIVINFGGRLRIRDFLLFSLTLVSLVTLYPITTSNSWVYYPLEMLFVVPYSLIYSLASIKVVRYIVERSWFIALPWLLMAVGLSFLAGGTYELYISALAVGFAVSLAYYLGTTAKNKTALITSFVLPLPGLAVFAYLRSTQTCSQAECTSNQTLAFSVEAIIKNLSLFTESPKSLPFWLVLLVAGVCFLLIRVADFMGPNLGESSSSLRQLSFALILGALAISGITAFTYEAQVRVAGELAMTPYRSGAPASVLLAMGITIWFITMQSGALRKWSMSALQVALSLGLATSLISSPMYFYQTWSSERSQLENSALRELLQPSSSDKRCEITKRIGEDPTTMQKVFLRDIDRAFIRLHDESFCIKERY